MANILVSTVSRRTREGREVRGGTRHSLRARLWLRLFEKLIKERKERKDKKTGKKGKKGKKGKTRRQERKERKGKRKKVVVPVRLRNTWYCRRG